MRSLPSAAPVEVGGSQHRFSSPEQLSFGAACSCAMPGFYGRISAGHVYIFNLWPQVPQQQTCLGE